MLCDPVGVPAGGELASPQLEDAEGARLALGRPRGREVDDRVGDGELRSRGDLVLGVLADPERRGRVRREVAGEVVEESAKVGPRRVRRERLEAVDDDDPGTALLEEGADPLGHPVQAMLVEDCAEIVTFRPA